MPSYKRIQKKIAVSYDCGHGSIIIDYDMPGLTPRERRNVMEKLSGKYDMSNKLLDTITTLDIVKALSKRYGVVCNSAENTATIFIVSQEDQNELTRFCSEKFIEAAAG